MHNCEMQCFMWRSHDGAVRRTVRQTVHQTVRRDVRRTVPSCERRIRRLRFPMEKATHGQPTEPKVHERLK
jgi:hypothetical protein